MFSRLKEPSSWASLGALIGGLTFLPHAHEIGGAVTDIGRGVAAVFLILGFFLPERKA